MHIHGVHSVNELVEHENALESANKLPVDMLATNYILCLGHVPQHNPALSLTEAYGMEVLRPSFGCVRFENSDRIVV